MAYRFYEMYQPGGGRTVIQTECDSNYCSSELTDNKNTACNDKASDSKQRHHRRNKNLCHSPNFSHPLLEGHEVFFDKSDDQLSLDSGYDGLSSTEKSSKPLHYYCFPDKGITVIAEGDWQSQCDTESQAGTHAPDIEKTSSAGDSPLRDYELLPEDGWDSDDTLRFDDCLSPSTSLAGSSHKSVKNQSISGKKQEASFLSQPNVDTVQSELKPCQTAIPCSNKAAVPSGVIMDNQETKVNPKSFQSHPPKETSDPTVHIRPIGISKKQQREDYKQDLIKTWLKTSKWRGTHGTHPDTDGLSQKSDHSGKAALDVDHKESSDMNYVRQPSMNTQKIKPRARVPPHTGGHEGGVSGEISKHSVAKPKRKSSSSTHSMNSTNSSDSGYIVFTNYHRYTIDDIVDNYCKIVSDIDDLETQTTTAKGSTCTHGQQHLEGTVSPEDKRMLEKKGKSDNSFERNKMRRSLKYAAPFLRQNDTAPTANHQGNGGSDPKDNLASSAMSGKVTCSTLFCGLSRKQSSRASQVLVKRVRAKKREIFC